jgi:hypothetical protein
MFIEVERRLKMNKTLPATQIISGHIEQFRKITPTLATFRVNGTPCKAEHLAVAYVERWSKNADCVYEFQGAYQQSRFGREFVVAHGHPEVLGISAADRAKLARERQIEFYMDLMKNYTPHQLRATVGSSGNHEYDREAARRLLESAPQAEVPAYRAIASPRMETETRSETTIPSARQGDKNE